MSRPGAVPKVPTLPAGDEVAAYSTYLEAQKAVDYLSDNKFPVENVTIVGTDLRMVERVTGRLTYGRVALAGALSGAWFGFFVGLLLTLFAGGSSGFQVMFAGIALGAGFGLLFSILSYSFTGGRRDFTSSSQIVAATYAILCGHDLASDARALLVQSPGGLGKSRGGATVGSPPVYGTQAPAAAAPPTPGAPPAPAAPPARPTDPRWVTPSGEPRYGAMRPGSDTGAGASGAGGSGAGGSGAGGSGAGSSGAGSSGASGAGAAAPGAAGPGAPGTTAGDGPSDAAPAGSTESPETPPTSPGPRPEDDTPTSRTNPYAPPTDD
ncbi:hypothetical protein APR03_002312 [Promicromonospora thailandica]|uniref:General stress protein 17M-like domain-containing protein n=2 Tax=Promicromonospora thailandica TaxID=765201 RepID=A0A9X2G846_9MICO|nr:hypothetical protein [Promicromonospora thailandica]BFF18751.1 hypothetical protein GCM10025730_22720 [Promicromonospora thailandica]